MGLFFEQNKPNAQLVAILRNAIEAQPDEGPHEQAVTLAGRFEPLVEPLQAALESSKPATPAAADADANTRATAVTNELLGGATFNTGRFLVALAIFVVLLCGAIGSDIAELKDSPTTLFALATTVFGIVVGFLGSEKS
jgi:hypothetical protein